MTSEQRLIIEGNDLLTSMQAEIDEAREIIQQCEAATTCFECGKARLRARAFLARTSRHEQPEQPK